MKVSDVLGLKKSLENAIRSAQGNIQYVAQYGQGIEDGIIVSAEESGQKFGDLMTVFKQMLEANHTLNSVLASYNVKTGLSDMVRARENCKALIGLYSEAIQRSKPSKQKRVDRLQSGETKVVETEFRPFTSAKELKAGIKALRLEAMQLQRDINALNEAELDVPYTEEELVELTMADFSNSDML